MAKEDPKALLGTEACEALSTIMTSELSIGGNASWVAPTSIGDEG